MLDELRLVRAVDDGREEEHAVRAVLLGVFRPLPRLVPADPVHAGDDQSAPGHGIHRGLHDLAALLVGERGVLAERAVRADAAASVADQPVAVGGVPVVVDGEAGRRARVLLEREGGGDDDAAEVELLVSHFWSFHVVLVWVVCGGEFADPDRDGDRPAVAEGVVGQCAARSLRGEQFLDGAAADPALADAESGPGAELERAQRLGAGARGGPAEACRSRPPRSGRRWCPR